MKGIERITDRIGADVQAEIDGVTGYVSRYFFQAVK